MGFRLWVDIGPRLYKGWAIHKLLSLSSDSGNLARGRPTFASSAQRDETTSSRAVDGVFYESGHAFENCYASEYEETPWWMLQLNRPYGITYIYIMACGKHQTLLRAIAEILPALRSF